jgi:hypothetical protein
MADEFEKFTRFVGQLVQAVGEKQEYQPRDIIQMVKANVLAHDSYGILPSDLRDKLESGLFDELSGACCVYLRDLAPHGYALIKLEK